MADSDDIVRDKILTFRTITTLLEMLQFLNGTPMPIGHWQFPLLRGFSAFNLNTSDSGSQDDYLAALATLLARDLEFAAVAITHRQGSIWELTICSHEESPKATVIPGPQITASNTHPSTMRQDFPILLPDACDIDPLDPLPYLRKTWTSQSYQQHAAAVVRLFSSRSKSLAKIGIFAYVASKTYRRILRRIQHPKYSLPFVRHLFAQSGNSQSPFPEDRPLHSRDIVFIKTLSESSIRPILKLSEINIPNIMAAVNSYQENGTPPRIYTDTTCHEFHELLCHLLRKFEEFLLVLDKYTGRALSDDDMTLFEIAIYRVAACGIILRDLVFSSYLKDHLARMDLPDPSGPSYDVDQIGADIDVGDDWDAELVGVQPRAIHLGTPLSVRDAYTRWLRLQVVHFEAANKLLAFMSGRSPMSFTLKVVGDYPKGTQMHPWKEVIKNVMSFPTTGPPSSYSAQDAIAAIEKAVSSNSAFQGYLNIHMENGGNFYGTLHCGASMAGIIRKINQDASTPVDNAVALSNQCCRVCSHLFSLLGAREEYLEALVPSPNQRITACTLPPWLPVSVLDSMITFFGKELRSLVQKMDAPSRSSSPHSVADSVNATLSTFTAFLDNIRRLMRI